MALVAYRKKASSQARRRSSIFPKLVFYKGSAEHDDTEESSYIGRLGATKNRRLSVKNNRRVVEHLRSRLGSIKEREILYKEISDGYDSEEPAINSSSKMLTGAATLPRRKVLFSDNQFNGVVHHSIIHRPDDFDNDVLSSSVPKLPTIIAEERERTSSDDSFVEEDNKRPTTPGIFVDWKSDSEHEDYDDVATEYRVNTNRSLWSSKKKPPREADGLNSLANQSRAFLWNVNSNVPELPKKVKVFISSDGTMKRERQVLLTDVFPKLVMLSAKLSMEFEMVDLSLDCSPRRKVLAQHHIRDSVKESAGTSFLLLLSNDDTYNQCTTLPHDVPAEIMQKFLRKPILEILACEAAIRKIGKSESEVNGGDPSGTPVGRLVDDGRNSTTDTTGWIADDEREQLIKRIKSSQKSLRILKKYYELDENVVPPHFTMKEQNRNPAHDKYLTNVFLRYIKIIHYDPIVEDWKNANLQPDTTSDIFLAFQAPDPRRDFLCFYRAEEKDTPPEEKRKFVQIRNRIGYNNTRIYHMCQDEMEKLSRGKDPRLKDSNSKYLEKFKSDAYNMILNQIRRKSEQREGNNESQSMHQTIAHHLRFLHNSHKGFVGREDILRSIKKYIMSNVDSVPLALLGERGCGLSSIMGMVASKVLEWYSSTPHFGIKHRQPIVIYRSVGVTGESTFMKELLFGICCQLQDIARIAEETRIADKYRDTPIPAVTMGGIQYIREQLVHLLTTITKNGVAAFIFIDNMSDISPIKEGNITNWLPSPMPKNVKVIISLSVEKMPFRHECEQGDVTNIFARKLLKGCNIVNVPKFHFPDGRNGIHKLSRVSNTALLLRSFSRKSSKTVTKSQMRILLQHLNFPTSCHHLEMLSYAAATWKSFASERTSLKMLESWCPDTAAETLLSILEHNHVKTFYRSALCFLSLARNGLTQREIIDLVARDNKYIGNLPVNNGANQSYSMNVTNSNKRTMRRLALKPTLSAASERCVSVFEINARWYQLKQDIAKLLMSCFTDGTVTLKWQHAMYSEAVKAKYMPNPEELTYYHRIMSMYFSNVHERCRCGKTHDCHQPLRWCGTSTSCSTINRRRLSESIFHAIRCNDLEHIKFEMLFNYEWLQAKLDTTSIEFLMDEIYNVLLMKTDDSDVRLLLEALFLSYDVLNSDASQLPSHLIGRLNDIIESDVPLAPEDPRKYPHARVLLYHIRRSKSQYLMPTTTCLTSGAQIICDPLFGHEDAITAIACCTDGQRIATASKDSTIKIWDIIERRVLRTIPGVGCDINSLCMCMGNYYVACSHENNHVNVWNIQKAINVLNIREYDPAEKIHCTVAVEGQFLAIVSKMSATIRVWDLDKLGFHKQISIRPEKWKCPDLSVARNSYATNILIGYKNFAEAIVVNVRRGRIIRNLSCEENGRITQVEVSREYYIVGCRERKMEVHELQMFFLYDSINYGLVRALKACSEDNISHIFVNRLGSHLIGISTNAHGADEVMVWNMETDSHRHMVHSHKKMFGGACTDLQYCMTIIENEWVVRINNLAAQITKHDHSRTQIRKKVDGIAKLYSMPKHDKYVVAQGTGGSPITIWNVARRRCKGKAVIIERGLLDKNDIVVVKDVMVVILSDRGMMSLKRQAFETIYVYNLLLRKYERKLHPVRVNICPPDHYHLIGDDKLLATSIDRTYMTIWSVVTGEVLQEIHPSFPKYELKPQPKRPVRRRRGNKTRTPRNEFQKIKTNWKTCRVSPQEQLKAIYEMILSSDDSTLVCSYYARHMIVFDLNSGSHKHTLTDKNSTLHLNKAVINSNGTFLLCTNYDNEAHTSYLTLWDLTKGVVTRRKQDEPKVCSVAMTNDGSRIVFATEDNLIKIWDPFRRQSHRSIAGYSRLDVESHEGDECQPTTIYITKGGKRAILFANSISVWDLESESLVMVFEPDYKFVCCAVAMHGNVIVVGRRDSPSITTLRLPEEEDSKSIQDINRFGEDEESDYDSSLPGSEEEDA